MKTKLDKERRGVDSEGPRTKEGSEGSEGSVRWGAVCLVRRVYVGLVLEQQPHNVEAAAGGGQGQGGFAVL